MGGEAGRLLPRYQLPSSAILHSSRASLRSEHQALASEVKILKQVRPRCRRPTGTLSHSSAQVLRPYFRPSLAKFCLVSGSLFLLQQ